MWPGAAIARAHELGCRVTAHVFGEQAVAELVAAGIDGIEHGTGIDDATIALMAERQVALVPTMIQLDNFETYAQAGEDKYPGVREAHACAVRQPARAVRQGARRRRPDLRRHRRGWLPAARPGRPGDRRAGGSSARRSTRSAPAPGGPAPGSADPTRLSEGAPADLVVFDADPRVDLAVLSAPRHVILRGAVVA